VGDAAAIQRFLQLKGTRGPKESAMPAVSHMRRPTADTGQRESAIPIRGHTVGDAAAIQRFLQRKGIRGLRESAISAVSHKNRPTADRAVKACTESEEIVVIGSTSKRSADVSLEEEARRKIMNRRT
jgi:hypothetical protein